MARSRPPATARLDLQVINRRNACLQALATGMATALPAGAAPAPVCSPGALPSTPSHALETLDMVYANPGEAAPATRYLDPAFLAGRGYTATVIEHGIEGVPLLADYDPALVVPGSPEQRFAETLRTQIDGRIRAAKAQGLKVYAWVQYVVLPKALLQKHGARLVDGQGRLDVRRPETQRVLQLFTAELLSTFPALDGLIVRTGEVYLHNLPYHDSGLARPATGEERLIQSATAITHGMQSHRALISLLRDAVCVKAGRQLFYRTWDFGHNFHNNTRYYLDVTDAIEPHPGLAFSIKHQQGDFHRLVPFNPTLGTGRHRQIVEVQAQMEAYGKGAHPYYIGQGVIDGWEEYGWLMPHTPMRGLAALLDDERLAGVWTWSRGGGWDGPRIAHELWCDLNAYVVAGFARERGRSEAELFMQYARQVLRLTPAHSDRLREACLLSAQAVLRGQMTTLAAGIWEWWARDDTLAEPDLGDFLAKGLVQEAIAEKADAVARWQRIVTLLDGIDFADAPTGEFARVSARYGLHKYRVIAAGWTTLLLTEEGRRSGLVDAQAVRRALAAYDDAWADWRRLAADHPLCPSLHRPVARGGGPGLEAGIERCRRMLKQA